MKHYDELQATGLSQSGYRSFHSQAAQSSSSLSADGVGPGRGTAAGLMEASGMVSLLPIGLVAPLAVAGGAVKLSIPSMLGRCFLNGLAVSTLPSSAAAVLVRNPFEGLILVGAASGPSVAFVFGDLRGSSRASVE